MCVRSAQPKDEQRTRSSREKTNKRNVRQNRSDNGGANQKMDLKVREMAKEPEKLLI